MPWWQLSVICAAAQVSAAEAMLEEAGAAAVTLTDAADAPILEPDPDSVPLWPEVRLLALFEDDDGAGLSRATAALSALAALSPAAPQLARVPEQDWRRAGEEHRQPRRFGRRLWVCPPGQTVAQRDAVVVALEPGLAFGTGSHPSTALCLDWLDAQPLTGARVLDYGCGSGILAIAALKLGARWALAIDHDPQALAATHANAVANGVAERIATATAADWAALTVDVTLANILAAPLIALAPRLAAATAPGGALALSGLLVTQIEQVAAAYRAAFALEPPQSKAEWALLAGRRRQ